MKTTKTWVMLFALGMIACIYARSQSPGFEWALQVGVVGSGYLTSDPSGNQIITGSFSGTVDFDPGSGVFYLTSAGEKDIFIQKLDGNGNLLWASRIGDVYDDGGGKVVTDASGNIYMLAGFQGTIDVDPGPGVYIISQDKSTPLILKIDPDGDLIWARMMDEDGTAHVGVRSISVDNDQNVITVGTFLHTTDFDPGPGTYNVTSTSPFNVPDDYIHKMDASGNFIWVKILTGGDFHYVNDVVTDNIGDIYYTCGFWGTVDFDPSIKGKCKLTAGGGWMNSCIGKLTANGDFAWAGQIYSDSSQNSSGPLALDPAGNLYVTGVFGETCDFDPGTGVFYMDSGNGTVFILKLNPSGNFLWAKQMIGAGGIRDIETDASGNVYLGGAFANTADFDPGEGTLLLTSYGIGDVFIFKCNSSGDMLWVTQTGGTEGDNGASLTVVPSGHIYAVGEFRGTVDFNPDGTGVFEMTSTGEEDIFIQKLNPAGGSNCPMPDGLNATNIGETSATLGWNAVTGATGYYVRYRQVLTSPWTESEMVTGTSLVLDNLTAATGYEFRVKTSCQSNYSYAFEFVTLGGGCTDNYEPNQGPETAAPMPVNSDLIALISSATDHDWFSFSTTATAKNIKIILTDLPADYDLQLCNPDGIPKANSHNTGTTDEIILYNPKKSGSYTIHVSGSGGVYDPVNCYTLILEVSSTAYKSSETDAMDSGEASSLAVFPNPASGMLEIHLTQAVQGCAEIAMINTSGQFVMQKSVNMNDGGNKLVVDVTGFPNGLYLIRMKIADKMTSQKIMIIH